MRIYTKFSISTLVYNESVGLPGQNVSIDRQLRPWADFSDFNEKQWKSWKILILHCKTQHSGTFFRIFLVFHRNQENLEAAGARLVKVAENQENHENPEKYWFCIEKHSTLAFFFGFSWFFLGIRKIWRPGGDVDLWLRPGPESRSIPAWPGSMLRADSPSPWFYTPRSSLSTLPRFIGRDPNRVWPECKLR